MTTRNQESNDRAAQLNEAISRKIALLRRRKEMSFDELAARSEVSKGMLVRIEQGRANPSIATLCKLAASLRVSVAELVATNGQKTDRVKLVAADLSPVLWRGGHGGAARLLVGSDGPEMLELWDWTLRRGERYASRAHREGTQELINVTDGALSLEVDGAVHVLAAGASAFARTDCAHSYACAGGRKVRFTMAVYEKTDPRSSSLASEIGRRSRHG